MLAALGLTGAAAATLSVLPRQPADQAAAAQAQPRPAPEKGGGYALTEHVKRYYQTTLI
jgi:hypothetical protein